MIVERFIITGGGENLNLADAVAVNAEKHPGKTAILIGEEKVAYEELNTRINRIARVLSAQKIQRGDRVCLIGPNSVAWVEALYGILRVGAVVIPINIRLTEGEMIDQIENSRPSAVVFDPECPSALISLLIEARREYRIFSLSTEEDLGCPSLLRLARRASSSDLTPLTRGDDPAVILFTGGTTGIPKGVILTHHNLIWSIVNMMVENDTPRAEQIMLHPFPLFHFSGLARLLSFLWAGGTYVTVKSFNAKDCLRLIEQERVSVTLGGPAVFLPYIEEHTGNPYDLSCVRICHLSFGFMHPEKKTQFKETLWPQALVYEGYGSTEGGIISILRPEHRPEDAGSCGRPCHQTRVKIVNDSGLPLPVGEIGEICAKGPQVAAGYFDNPEETNEIFLDGWLMTGDLGKIDRQGFLYIVDRKKDMIKSGGENIYSFEVEEVLMSHPGIQEAAVIGVPHERWGETPKAIVVRRPGQKISESDVIEHCRRFLVSYKKPTSVEFVDLLPKSAFGKVMKKTLKEGIINSISKP